MESLIRLFHAVEVKGTQESIPSSIILRRTIPQGFIFDARVFGSTNDVQIFQYAEEVNAVLGLSGAQMNTSFHKSWNKVATAPIEQLYIEQILHYITTYGFEALGVFSHDTVFIPPEALTVPDYKGTNLTVIHGLTAPEIKARLLKLLQTGVALSTETVEDATAIAKTYDFTREDIETVRNKEVKLRLYDALGVMPSDPSEFMRFLIFKSTGETLLIKDKKTVEGLKQGIDLTLYIRRYALGYGLEPLASVFYRYKPLFLALKRDPESNRFVNRIRKLAPVHHKPMPRDLLNDLTGILRHGDEPDTREFSAALGKANIFRRIRLAYALKYRADVHGSIQFKIRNGKSYAKDYNFWYPDSAQSYFDMVYETIVASLRLKVLGKRIYIPPGVTYALPATEKQFTGNIPSGSSIALPSNAVFGVYWENMKDKTSVWGRVDLDLAIMDQTGKKHGWDGSYRSSGDTVLFSGDVVDADPCATELFHINKQTSNTYLMTLNYYNFSESTKIPFKIMVGSSNVPLTRNYMIDPNAVLMIANTETTHKQKLLGIISVTPHDVRFIFSEAAIGSNISFANKPYIQHARDFMVNFYSNTISLNTALSDAGAILTPTPNMADIDLSPALLTKDTIISLLS